MDDQTRASLLLEQEKAKANVTRLRAGLATMGHALTIFGSKVESQPENVIFANAPNDELGSIPQHLMGAPAFTWDEIPDKKSIARLILELRKEIKRLEDTQQKLRVQ